DRGEAGAVRPPIRLDQAPDRRSLGAARARAGAGRHRAGEGTEAFLPATRARRPRPRVRRRRERAGRPGAGAGDLPQGHGGAGAGHARRPRNDGAGARRSRPGGPHRRDGDADAGHRHPARDREGAGEGGQDQRRRRRLGHRDGREYRGGAGAGGQPGVRRQQARPRSIDLARPRDPGPARAGVDDQELRGRPRHRRGSAALRRDPLLRARRLGARREEDPRHASGGLGHSREREEVRRVLKEESAREVTAMLEEVVEKGTGTRAALVGHRAAGKTGTAQKVDPVAGGYGEKRLSSFLGFAPADEPRVAILVAIDEPEGKGADVTGGTVAAPAWAAIAHEALRQLDVMPDDARVDAPVIVSSLAGSADPEPAPEEAARMPLRPGQAMVPDVSGMGAR